MEEGATGYDIPPECHLLRLPNEILESILANGVLTNNDICSFARSSLKCNIICSSNELWKIKLAQRWPDILRHFTLPIPYKWKKEFRRCFLVSQMVHREVSEMSAKYHHLEEVSDSAFHVFNKMLQDSLHLHHLVMVTELMNIIHDKDMNGNLTIKFYATKVLRFVRQSYLIHEWDRFLSLREEFQILEKGATLVAQWCQPTCIITDESISLALDKIASRAREILYEQNKDHPLFSQVDQFELWRRANIAESQWNSSLCRQALGAVNKVIFSEMGFQGNNEHYYSPQNSYINKVLETKTGIPITLSIMYEAVARRLGVKCEAVNFPAHFLLRWLEKYNASNEEPTPYYIDVFNGGKFLTKRNCPRFAAEGDCPITGNRISHHATASEVFRRMANNLVVASHQCPNVIERMISLRSALELMLVVNPDDLDSIFHLARVYMQLNISVEEIFPKLGDRFPLGGENAPNTVQMLLAYESQFQVQNVDKKENKEVPKLRTSSESNEVKFAVGMIMKHKRYNYICVIYGWDPVCTASKEWIGRMGVRNLAKKERQPFYNVLVDDGSNRYAAQENLMLAREPKNIEHPEIGRYFEKFCGLFYVSNKERTRIYPEDAETKESFISNYFGFSSLSLCLKSL